MEQRESMNGHPKTGTLTARYLQRARDTFQEWCNRSQPTLQGALAQIQHIARETMRGLSREQVIGLLAEHPEWVGKVPVEHYDSDRMGNFTVAEIVRRHGVQFMVHELGAGWFSS